MERATLKRQVEEQVRTYQGIADAMVAQWG